jgi:hypothetical protein
MANANVTILVNRQTVGAALADARRKCADNLRWLNAVNRAALNMESCRWAFDGDTLRIESATDSGVFYTVTIHECPCKAHQAGRPCWHRAGCRLLIKAAELAYTAATTNGYQDAPARPFEDAKPSYAELTAAVDDLFV